MYANINELREAHNKGEKHKYLLFWGHKPAKDGSITSACLSQWWQCKFSEDNIEYSSAEQYMTVGKAKLFGDDEIFMEIIYNNSPKTVKALGRKVKHFNDDIWKENRFDIVTRGNIAKFSQNKDLMEFLISTKDSILVEASPFDRIWGIGMGKENEFAENPLKWRGSNLLGFALMKVREEILKKDGSK